MHGRKRDSRPRLFLAIFCGFFLLYGGSSYVSGPRAQVAAGDTTNTTSVSSSPSPFSCTLVTQTNLGRISGFTAILNRWKGRIAIAVLFPFNTTSEAVAATTGHFPSRVSVINVIHKEGEYPVNILRNMALKLATTSHYLMIDIDVVPSGDLEEILMHSGMNKWLADPKMALIVPVFEYVSPSPCEGANCLSAIPSSYSELTACVQDHKCKVHEVSANDSQSTTDNERWLNSNLTQKTYPILCFHSLSYEPYVLLPRLPATPLHNERFVGYGKNKVQHITHLRFVGFNFRVVAKGFLFHQAHQASATKTAFMDPNSDLNKRMTQLFQEFKVSLERKFLAPSIPLCVAKVRAVKEDGDEPIIV